MHSLTVTYGSFTFPVFPALSITRKPYEDGGTLETWSLAGIVRGANQQALEQARANLEAALAIEGQMLALKQGVASLRVLDPANARIAPIPKELRWDDGDAASFKGELSFHARFEAVLQDNANVVQSLSLTVTHSEDVSGRVTLTTEGRATLRNDIDDDAAMAALALPVDSSMRRVNTRFVLRPDHVADFAFVDESVFKALPGGIRDGHYTRTRARDEEGRTIVTIAGFFVGEAALARALELKPESVASEQVTENLFDRRVDFRFEFIDANATGGELRSVERFTFSESKRFVDHKLKAPGAPTYRQITGMPDFEITQEGSAFGVSNHPTPPAPLHTDALAEREVGYPVSPDGSGPFETRWRYVMKPLTPVALHLPR
ncbi:MAG: hypothetical protein L6Q71_10940 [Planctomycetes bacterium]|nr:hypothetical protein [Planctomycetota bacterium]NUQ35050.1 hypothetical protein [Planctomycetaceae bacterium]